MVPCVSVLVDYTYVPMYVEKNCVDSYEVHTYILLSRIQQEDTNHLHPSLVNIIHWIGWIHIVHTYNSPTDQTMINDCSALPRLQAYNYYTTT